MAGGTGQLTKKYLADLLLVERVVTLQATDNGRDASHRGSL